MLYIDIEKLRTFGPLAFKLNINNPLHPYIRTLQWMINKSSEKEITYEDSPLESYHLNVQPQSAAEIMGLYSNTLLLKMEALEYAFPWRGIPGKKQKKKRINTMCKDAEQFGYKVKKDNIWTIAGPLNEHM